MSQYPLECLRLTALGTSPYMYLLLHFLWLLLQLPAGPGMADVSHMTCTYV